MRLPAVVLGGGIAGLAAARLLVRHFPRVVVLERDRRPELPRPADAFDLWERPGVPQFRHSHAFLARIRQVLLARLPEVIDRLRAAGVREIRLLETAPPALAFAPRGDDEDLVLLACRRATFEWALHDTVRARPEIELREGVKVAGLEGTRRENSRPVVTGVRLADGELLPAALVVDATGRRSRAPEWLSELGAPPPVERSSDTGILYYTRFYRLRRSRPIAGTTGLVAGDLGWIKLAVFPGDDGTFSITVGAPVAEPRLRSLAQPRRFERFLAVFPSVAPWRRRGVSTPIAGPDTPVLVMGHLRNRRRRFVDAKGPLVAGFMAIGDAAYHSNPIYGRGATFAVVQAALLDEALERHPDDLRAAACHLDRRTEAELRPFWEAAVASDRRALGYRRRPAPGDLRGWLLACAEEAFGWFLDRGMVPASRVDPAVFRALMRVFNLLDPPDALLRDPEVLLRSVPVLARVLRGDVPPSQFPYVPRDLALDRIGPMQTAPRGRRAARPTPLAGD
jgi:2-polyprenyl-6-methoxyphenol hydroxylase-like FAD-dependent oxidoreductase